MQKWALIFHIIIALAFNQQQNAAIKRWMSSIIDFFKAVKYGTYNAFDKNDKYFCSTISSLYWHVTFERLVAVASYIITSKSSWSDWYMKQWKISYSINGSSFIDLKTESIDTLNENTKKFSLEKQINCKSFKITGFKASDDTDDLKFSSFDCFEPGYSLKRTRNQCLCNFYYNKRRLTKSFLLTQFPSFLT